MSKFATKDDILGIVGGIGMLVVVLVVLFGPFFAYYIVMTAYFSVRYPGLIKHFFYTLPVSLPLALGLLAWGGGWELKRNKLRQQFSSCLLGLLVLLVYLFILVACVELLVNGVLDSSPPVEHRVHVIEMEGQSHNPILWPLLVFDFYDFDYYFVKLESWRRDGEPVRALVDDSLYEQIKPNRTLLLVTTKAGRLGIEWVVSCAIIGEGG